MVDESRRKFLGQAIGAGVVRPQGGVTRVAKLAADFLPASFPPLLPAQIPLSAKHLIMINSAMGECAMDDYQGERYQAFGELLRKLKSEQENQTEFDPDLINGGLYHGLFLFLKGETTANIQLGQLIDMRNANVLRDLESVTSVRDYDGEFWDVFENTDERKTLGEFSNDSLKNGFQDRYLSILDSIKNAIEAEDKYPENLKKFKEGFVVRTLKEKEDFLSQVTLPEKWRLFLKAFTKDSDEEMEQLKSLTLDEFFEDYLRPILERRIEGHLNHILAIEDMILAGYELNDKFCELYQNEELLIELEGIVPDRITEIGKVLEFYNTDPVAQEYARNKFNEAIAPLFERLKNDVGLSYEVVDSSSADLPSLPTHFNSSSQEGLVSPDDQAKLDYDGAQGTYKYALQDFGLNIEDIDDPPSLLPYRAQQICHLTP